MKRNIVILETIDDLKYFYNSYNTNCQKNIYE